MTEDPAVTIDTRWFQDRLADKRLSQRKLASMMNLDPAAVSLMIRGKRKMSAAEAAEIATLLGVSVDEVAARSGGVGMPEFRRGEVATDVQASPKAMVTARSPDVLEIPVPMSDGTLATLLLPRVMTKQDAEKIASLVQILAVSG